MTLKSLLRHFPMATRHGWIIKYTRRDIERILERELGKTEFTLCGVYMDEFQS